MSYQDKEVQRAYQREWKRKRRDEYLADKACVRCGSTEGLELDHIDPTKKWTHRIWSYSKALRQIELEKCQVLCSDCHILKTAEQIGRSICPKGHYRDGWRISEGRRLRYCRRCDRERKYA